ncbi:MAG: cupredoxin domain-containing protein [Patescibacteria group bacterium]
MESSHIRKIFVGVIIVVAVGAVGFGLWQKNSVSQDANLREASAQKKIMPEPVPENVAVPEKGSEVGSGVAVPVTVSPASPGSSENLRVFMIEMDQNKFSAGKIIVYKGDSIRIEVKAVDKAYDFYQPNYNFKREIQKGKVVTISFQATETGIFPFYCKSCGGSESGPVLSLYVVPVK